MIKPKRGDRFVSMHILDSKAFEAGRRDVYATQVVTATRSWGSGPLDFAVFYTSADSWDAGSRKGRWYFDMKDADGAVREGLQNR